MTHRPTLIPTNAPVTKVPATKGPVTFAPVTRNLAPVTKSPVTLAPVTKAPVTLAPVTKAPRTKTPVAVAPAVAPTTFTPILINCGSTVNYTDSVGRTWLSDRFYTGGFPYDTNTDVSNTIDDVIYRSERYGHSSYSIPVPADGVYTVLLHFAEI
jgi:Malectin domain